VALEKVKNARVGLVLLDLMMPEMDGFAFLEEFRRIPSAGQVPVVVLTAKDLTSEDRKRLNGHVEKIMAKGEGTETVLRKVQALRPMCNIRVLFIDLTPRLNKPKVFTDNAAYPAVPSFAACAVSGTLGSFSNAATTEKACRSIAIHSAALL
jgi:CheY-like chemotaxis protein